LTPGDIAAIQALYGVRRPDANEGQPGNGTIENATRIRNLDNSDNYDGTTPLVVYGDRTTTSDVDFFRLRPIDSYRNAVTFRLQTAGVSVLAPRLTIMDKDGTVLGQAEASGPFGSVLTVRLANVDPDEKYFARVDSTAGDGFGIGSYALGVTFDAKLTTSPTLLDAVMRGPYEDLREKDLQECFRNPYTPLFNDDRHSDDTFSTATDLTTMPGYVPGTHFEAMGSLSDILDKDFYRFTAPGSGEQRNVLTVTAAAMQVNGVTPKLAVYDQFQNRVNAQILANGNGTYTVQVANATPNASYFAEVSARPLGSGGNTGNYALTVDFGRVVAQLRDFTQGAVTAERQEETRTLYVGQNQLFQFLLSAKSGSAPPVDAGVTMTILDKNGNTMFTLTARDAETVSSNSVFLSVGAYTVRFTRSTGSGNLFTSLAHTLRGTNLSDPIGPEPEDPTQNPYYIPGTNPPLFSYPGGVTSPNPFYFG
jgi:hypothetical protein